MLDLLKDTQISPSPPVQCCAKSRKTMLCSGGQEWPSKLATNIEEETEGASLTIFVTECLQSLKKIEKGVLKTQKNNFRKLVNL